MTFEQSAFRKSGATPIGRRRYAEGCAPTCNTRRRYICLRFRRTSSTGAFVALHYAFVGFGGKLNTLYDRAKDAPSSDDVIAGMGFDVEYQETTFVLHQAS
jgi:hypothetical protein